ncbi:MAG: vitamin B12-dependent ribonucleotide reductase, partial [Pseudomonadota bacterium]
VTPDDIGATALGRGVDGDKPKQPQMVSHGLVRGQQFKIIRADAPEAKAVEALEDALQATGTDGAATGLAPSAPGGSPVSTMRSEVAALLGLEAAADAPATKTVSRASNQERSIMARLKGFEGDPCGECGNFTLVRNGTCLKCDTCGATSGCS